MCARETQVNSYLRAYTLQTHARTHTHTHTHTHTQNTHTHICATTHRPAGARTHRLQAVFLWACVPARLCACAPGRHAVFVCERLYARACSPVLLLVRLFACEQANLHVQVWRCVWYLCILSLSLSHFLTYLLSQSLFISIDSPLLPSPSLSYSAFHPQHASVRRTSSHRCVADTDTHLRQRQTDVRVRVSLCV